MLKVGYEKSKFYLFVVFVFSADFSDLLYSRLKLDGYGWTHGMYGVWCWYWSEVDWDWDRGGDGGHIEPSLPEPASCQPSSRRTADICPPRPSSLLSPSSVLTHTHTRALAMGKSIGDSASDNAIRLHSATPTQKLGLLVFSSILVALLYCAPLPSHQSVVDDRNKARPRNQLLSIIVQIIHVFTCFSNFLPFQDIFVRCWNLLPLYVDEKLSHWSNDHFKHYKWFIFWNLKENVKTLKENTCMYLRQQ